jgi:hypothetical protein
MSKVKEKTTPKVIEIKPDELLVILNQDGEQMLTFTDVSMATDYLEKNPTFTYKLAKYL